MSTEKWAVLVQISDHMKRMFSDDELVTFAEVLAIYTLPQGIPQDDVHTDHTQEFIRAWVMVDGVVDGVVEGVVMSGTMTPEEITWEGTTPAGEPIRVVDTGELPPEVIPGTSSASP